MIAKKCKCGAITVVGDDFSNSMRPRLFRKKYPKMKLQPGLYYACDHCGNHWGLDICGCGSGVAVGKCRGGHASCRSKTAAQVEGQRNASSVEVIVMRGGFS